MCGKQFSKHLAKQIFIKVDHLRLKRRPVVFTRTMMRRDTIIVKKHLNCFDFSLKIPSFESGMENAKFFMCSTQQETFEWRPNYLAEFFMLETTVSSFSLHLSFNARE